MRCWHQAFLAFSIFVMFSTLSTNAQTQDGVEPNHNEPATAAPVEPLKPHLVLSLPTNTDAFAPLNTRISSNVIVAAHRQLGKSFWIPWAVIIGLAIADNELTVHCVQTFPGCNEGNPIFGKKPTRLELYGFKAGILGAGFYLSRKHKLEGKSDWKVEPILAIPIYSAVVTANAIRTIRASDSPHAALIANTPPRQVEIIAGILAQKSQ